MSLAPNSEVRLASGQTVRVEEGTTVKLDPSSSVRVVGDLKIDMPQPSKQQLQLETTSASDELPFTNYTIFRSVGYIFSSEPIILTPKPDAPVKGRSGVEAIRYGFWYLCLSTLTPGVSAFWV